MDSTIELFDTDKKGKGVKEQVKDSVYNMTNTFHMNQKKSDDSVIERMQTEINELKDTITELEKQMKVKNEVQGIEIVDENEMEVKIEE